MIFIYYDSFNNLTTNNNEVPICFFNGSLSIIFNLNIVFLIKQYALLIKLSIFIQALKVFTKYLFSLTNLIENVVLSRNRFYAF